MRTRLSICRRKARYLTRALALAAAESLSPDLRTYRCDRCRHHHLTSRRKGKRIARPAEG